MHLYNFTPTPYNDDILLSHDAAANPSRLSDHASTEATQLNESLADQFQLGLEQGGFDISGKVFLLNQTNTNIVHYYRTKTSIIFCKAAFPTSPWLNL